ncbi:post-transcriptional regulator [Bacillus infantis]|uniref:post-transcriptional regulator n=1 Tax=Bacillus infantis TaxID=324767 RepID=UPI003CE81EF6
MKGHVYEKFRRQVQPALQSKLEEFRLLNYGAVAEDELWKYLTEKKWRKPHEDARLFEIVGGILEVKAADYFSYATVEAFKGKGLGELSEEDRRKLLE